MQDDAVLKESAYHELARRRLILPEDYNRTPSLRQMIWQHDSLPARIYQKWILKSLDAIQFTTVPNDPWPGDIKKGQAIVQHQTTPSNNLEELRHLHAMGGNDARTKARELIEQWLQMVQFSMRRNKTEDSLLNWEVEDTALRVIHLFRHYSFYGYGAEARLQDQICLSLHRQLFWLEKMFPTQNASARFLTLNALIHAACSSHTFAPYLPEYLEVLETTLPEYLENGQHSSFCIAKQVLTLRRMIALRTLLNRDNQTPAFLMDAIYKAAVILKQLQMGDNKLPQLRSVPHMLLKHLQLLVGETHRSAFPDFPTFPLGFAVLSGRNTKVVIDVLEGSSALSFEATVGKQRLITCCGMPAQANANWEKALRCAAAASTLDKDWNTSIEIEEISQKRLVAHLQNNENHHRRVIEVTDRDYIKGYDLVQGNHNGFIRFHINPEIDISMPQTPDAAVLLNLPNGMLWKASASIPFQMEDSIYFDHTGEQHESHQLVIPIIEGIQEYTWVFKTA